MALMTCGLISFFVFNPAANAQTVTGGVLQASDRPQLFILMSNNGEAARVSTGANTGKTWICRWHDVYGFENDFDITPVVDYSRLATIQIGKKYMFSCSSDGRIVFERYTMYNPWQPISIVPTAFQELELFLQNLEYPMPSIFRNPPGDTLAGVRLYLWSDINAMRQQTLSTSWGSVTAEITVARMVWTLWDGQKVECFANEPLTWQRNDTLHIPAKNCSMVPQFDTSNYPNGRGKLSVSVTYNTKWRAQLLGQVTSGSIPTVTRQTTSSIRIRSLQAVAKTYR